MMSGWLAMVDNCICQKSKLDDCERRFIFMIDDRLRKGLGLTNAQYDLMIKIWERVTS